MVSGCNVSDVGMILPLTLRKAIPLTLREGCGTHYLFRCLTF
jgi:hypothetical protein